MKTSLVLEGGGMRGAYTAGCLAWLLDNGISFDSAYGISTGAVHLCSYLMKDKELLYDCSTDYIADEQLIGMKSIKREKTYVGYNLLFSKILPEAGYHIKNAKNSGCDAKIGVYDLDLGKCVYSSVNDIDDEMELLKASTTLPIIGRAVKYKGRLLLDGGISEMIPIRQAVEDGNKKHLVITTKPKDFVRKPANPLIVNLMGLTYPKHKCVKKDYAVRHLNYNAQVDQIHELEKAGNAIHISPSKTIPVKRMTGDKPSLRLLYDLGYNDMEAHKDEIIAAFRKA